VSYSKKLILLGKTKQPLPPFHSSTPPESEPKEDKVLGLPNAEDAVTEKAAVKTSDEAEVKDLIPEEVKEKKVVTFDVPADEEEDLTPLSRTTTVDLELAVTDETITPEVSPNGDAQSMTNSNEDISQDPAAPTTPKKKKTHRGRRGGRKLSRNQQKEEDEVNRIVDAAKQLEVGPRLQPDELTVSGGDVQNVSEIKRIGKLTIDQDRLLGNGSGGTFVFEGKWKVWCSCLCIHVLIIR